MRIPRCCQLQPNDVTHSIWRGHNREWIFKGRDNKQAYLRMFAEEASKQSDVSVHSFCVMNNHDHTMSSNKTVKGYSKLFQQVHGRYARRYNDIEGRRGAVGMDRPKSLAVQNERHLRNATFYIDANPVRAGIVKHPKYYQWGSYRYYAYGDTAYKDIITEPEWYRGLGPTAKHRQRIYRKLFDAYLRREGLSPKPGMANGHYIGDVVWILERTRVHNSKLNRNCRSNLESMSHAGQYDSS